MIMIRWHYFCKHYVSEATTTMNIKQTKNNTTMTNPAKEYELFTQSVYKQLSNYQYIGITKVHHNIKLKGRSGCKHQIDVYWEYEKDGVNHRVAIECKNYNKRVSKEKVCAFQGVLADLGDVEGIMVTKVGFQKGAKEYAKEYGISLKELRQPRVGETIIGAIEFHTHAEIRHRYFLIDEEWANEHHYDIAGYKKRLDMFCFDYDQKWINETHLPLQTSDDIIRNAKGDYIISLDSLELQIPKNPTKDFPYIFKFDNAFVTTPWGPVKILEVKYDYEIDEQKKIINIDAEGFVKAILKDAISGKTDYIPRY